jgi:hypothetical protein
MATLTDTVIVSDSLSKIGSFNIQNTDGIIVNDVLSQIGSLDRTFIDIVIIFSAKDLNSCKKY